MSMASRGTRTWLKAMKPLSTLLKLQAGRAGGGQDGQKGRHEKGKTGRLPVGRQAGGYDGCANARSRPQLAFCTNQLASAGCLPACLLATVCAPHLWADVAHLNAGQGQVCLHVADLDHKGVRPVVLALHKQPRHEDALEGEEGKGEREVSRQTSTLKGRPG